MEIKDELKEINIKIVHVIILMMKWELQILILVIVIRQKKIINL